jgi:hypothetical protein
LVLFNPYVFLSFFFPLPLSFPLMGANASVHNSRAPEVQIVRPEQSFFDLPISLLLTAYSLGAQPVLLLLDGSDYCPAARLSPRLAFRNSPSGATGAGDGAAAAAAAAAEAAWCCASSLPLPLLGQGRGGGYTSHCS